MSNNLITCSSPKQYVMNFNLTLANEVDINDFLYTYFSSYLNGKMTPFNQLITTYFRFQCLLANNTPILVNGQYQYQVILLFTYPALILTQNAVLNHISDWQFNFYVDNTQGSDVLDPTLPVQTIYLFSDLQTAAGQYNNANSTNIVITNLQQVQKLTWWQSIFNLFFGWIGPVQQWIDTWGLAVVILVLLIFFLILLAIIKFVLS